MGVATGSGPSTNRDGSSAVPSSAPQPTGDPPPDGAPGGGGWVSESVASWGPSCSLPPVRGPDLHSPSMTLWLIGRVREGTPQFDYNFANILQWGGVWGLESFCAPMGWGGGLPPAARKKVVSPPGIVKKDT